jgi:hypothetical protein
MGGVGFHLAFKVPIADSVQGPYMQLNSCFWVQT